MAVVTEMTALDAKNHFGRLIELAQRAPVTITRNGRPSVVVMSADAYERKRKAAAHRLGEVLERTRREAARKGLTEAELDALLADDS
ncbi:MAG TPA: type II toxin-antitoxin system prevent-host-death family antitoxin [Sphingomonadaceae bacterium]|nr:type II toxin-antitoxin system prevent-host-death family antitoxin [Sphingomonadaceae bacterium]